MKNPALMLSTVLIATLSAEVHAVAVSPQALINPTPQVLQAACDAGYQSGEAGASPQDVGPEFGKYVYSISGDLSEGVTLQTAQGGAFSLCSSKGKNLESKPTSIRSDAVPLVIMLSGFTTSNQLKEVEDWAAVLSFQDAAGHELARLTPTTQREGRLGSWKVNCVAGNCNWAGSNYYLFDLTKIASTLKTSALKATKVAVLYNQGNGVQTVYIDSNQVGKF